LKKKTKRIGIDSEEFVVYQVLKSLSSLTELRLIDKHQLKSILMTILPLLCHPNPWIRYAAVSLIAVICSLLPKLDLTCLIQPMLQPFLKYEIPEIIELELLEALKDPVRYIFLNFYFLLKHK
jgi:phosphoinositide-3-kinase regulatory subunit 4